MLLLYALGTICPGRCSPLLFGKIGLPEKRRMEAIAFVDMFRLKTDSEDIIEVGIGQATICNVLLENIAENRVIDIAYHGMKLFSANTVRPVISMDGVRIKVRTSGTAIIYRICQEIAAGNESPCKEAPFIIS